MDLQIIDLVKAHDVLYNTTNQNYHNKEMKEKAWMDISNHLGKSVKEIEQRWQVLRQEYIREKRRLETKLFHEAMSFLDPCNMSSRTTYSNIKNVNEDDSGKNTSTNNIQKNEIENSEEPAAESSRYSLPECVLDCDEEDDSSVNNENEEPSCSYKANPPLRALEKRRKRTLKRRRNSSSSESEIMSYMNESMKMMRTFLHTASTGTKHGKCPKCLSNEDDADLLFGKSVGLSMRHIVNERAKTRAKKEIWECLERAMEWNHE